MQPVDAVFDALLWKPFPIHHAKPCRSCTYRQGVRIVSFLTYEVIGLAMLVLVSSADNLPWRHAVLPIQCRLPHLSRKPLQSCERRRSLRAD